MTYNLVSHEYVAVESFDIVSKFYDFPEGVVPRNTNSLEGGVNSNLKQLNFCHHGIRADEERIMLGWDLVRKSEFGLDGFFNEIKIKKFSISPSKVRGKFF